MADQVGEPLELFEWLALLALALGRKKVSQQAGAIAMFVALDSKGTTGRGAVIDARRLATELDLSERQIWRHFKKLCADGWFEQTHLPARGYGGPGTGRRARYRLTHPPRLMSDEIRVTLPGCDVSDEDAESTTSSDTFAVHRLTLSGESCDIAEREDGTVPPSVGTPSVGSPSGHPSALTTGHAREAVRAMDGIETAS